jgi:hypothetical protein
MVNVGNNTEVANVLHLAAKISNIQPLTLHGFSELEVKPVAASSKAKKNRVRF